MHAIASQLVRWALMLFSRRVVVAGNLDTGGPLLLLANHPNGFLDGILVASQLRRPVWFLGRGELFPSRTMRMLLKCVHILPLYDAGRDSRLLATNAAGLAACRKIWKKNGIVLLFAEGETKQEWGLRQLKKTAFRLVDPAMHSGDKARLRCQCAGLHYHPFTGINKQILVRLDRPFAPLRQDETPAKRSADFQHLLREKMIGNLCPDPLSMRSLLPNREAGAAGNLLLALPAMAGLLLHAPLYVPVKTIVSMSIRPVVFRESALFLLLFCLYPLYWITINAAAWAAFHSAVVSMAFLLMPVWARCYILWRKKPG